MKFELWILLYRTFDSARFSWANEVLGLLPCFFRPSFSVGQSSPNLMHQNIPFCWKHTLTCDNSPDTLLRGPQSHQLHNTLVKLRRVVRNNDTRVADSPLTAVETYATHCLKLHVSRMQQTLVHILISDRLLISKKVQFSALIVSNIISNFPEYLFGLISISHRLSQLCKENPQVAKLLIYVISHRNIFVNVEHGTAQSCSLSMGTGHR
jgi:hypothetical protein